jgi:hypothetical protein
LKKKYNEMLLLTAFKNYSPKTGLSKMTHAQGIRPAAMATPGYDRDWLGQPLKKSCQLKILMGGTPLLSL